MKVKAEKNVELIVFASQLEQHGWIPALTKLLEHKKEFDVYVVGGTLRDALLGIPKQHFDMDLLIDPKPASKKAAEILSKELESNFFELDAKRDTYRISFDNAQVDVNGIRGEALMDDLFLRDFSMDALCLPLDNFLRVYSRGDTRMGLLDYFQGIEDMLSRKVRIHNPASFEDDPLRLLRAYRLAGEISGHIDPWTEEQISIQKEKLFEVSGERIRDEWLKILALSHCSPWLSKMDESGLLSIVFPFLESFVPMDEKYTQRLQVRRHTLETLQYLEEIFERIRKFDFPYAREIESMLNETLVPDRNLKVLLKLVALLHDIGKPDTISMEEDRLRFFDHESNGAEKAKIYLKDLKLSNREQEWIEGLILEHMRPHQLSNADLLTERAKYRFFRDLGSLAVPILLLGLSDAYATRRVKMPGLPAYEAFVADMLDYGFKKEKEAIAPLLNGNDIMKLLDLAPCPKVGKLIEALLEAQHLQQVCTRREAEAFMQEKSKTI